MKPLDLSLIVTALGAVAVFVMLVVVFRVGTVGIFAGIADFLEGAERSVIDILSAFVPYCVPVIPAYLTYYHTHDPKMMNFPVWVAVTAAFVVETLGMASVSTAIKFWRNNLLYSSQQNKAPFKLALGVYAFYIVVVLAVNVILEIVSGMRNGWVIVSIALFSMLSFPSGVLVAIRAQFREILDARHKPKVVTAGSGLKQSVEPRKKHASDYFDKMIQMLNVEYEKSQTVLTPKQVTMKLGLDHDKAKGFVSTTITKWAAGKGVEKTQKPPFP